MAPNFQHFWILGERYGYFFTAFVFFSCTPPPPPTLRSHSEGEFGSDHEQSSPFMRASMGAGGKGGVRWEV